MDCIFGMKCNDFSIIASDMLTTQSIFVIKTNENKLYNISNNLVMGVAGEPSVRTWFAEYIAKNIQLYKMRNKYELSPKEVATFSRRIIADSVRSILWYQVNLLLAGYDQHDGSELYFIDYLGAMVNVDYAGHGYGGYFSLPIMDQGYQKTLNPEQAYELMKKCIAETHKRLLLSLPNFHVKIIDKNGIQNLPPIRVG